MKKIIYPLVLFLASFSVYAQEDIKSVLTSGKWFVVSTQEAGEQPEEADDKNDEWVIFMPDGKTEENHFGDNVNSKWSYSAKDKTIKLIGIENKIQKIIEVTKDKLIVELFENGQGGVIVTYAK